MRIMVLRSGQDRRNRDTGPTAGCTERRFHAERRLPQVVEQSISDAEWRVYFGKRVGWPMRAVNLRDTPADIPDRLWSDF